MTRTILLSALALVTAVSATTATAHSTHLAPRDPMAMPELAPARALMRTMQRGVGPQAQVLILSEVDMPTRRATRIGSFGFAVPPVVLRHQGPGCDVILTPNGGWIETCVGPMPGAILRPMPRPRGVMGDLDLRIESY